MYLKRIELNGFKSFPEKYEILMDKNITGIVGPNGSGKSNICDAIRWVLGEQSAKSLRGDKMEDVIFDGTQTRKKKSYCEVSLVFDNEDRRLMSDFSEIQISRKMYRTGESEYYINNSSVRLKDVLELFRDTGVGKEGYSIVGQGRIDEIINEKAAARRKVFEEAAGIMKYRVRKEEAERKLQRTDDNLIRVNDIVEELSSQIEPLRIQCEQAKKFFSLRERQKDLEINLFLHEFDKAEEKISKYESEISAFNEETDLLEKELEKLSMGRDAEEEELFEVENRIIQINESISNIKAKSENISGQLNLLNEKKANVHSQITRYESEIEECKEKIAGISEIIVSANEKDRALSDEMQQLDGKIKDISTSISNLTSYANGNVDLDEIQSQIINRINELSDIKSSIAALEASRLSFDTREEEYSSKVAVLKREIADFEKQIANKEAELADLKSKKSRNIVLSNEISSELFDAKQDIEKKKEELNKLLSEKFDISSQIKMLKDLKDSLDGYQDSVKALLKAAKEDSEINKRIIGSVISSLNVEERYETAIEMALGAAAQNIVVENEQDAKYLIEYLRNSRSGRVSFLPLTSLKVKELLDDEAECLKEKGIVGVASSLVECDNKVKKAIDFLLGRVVVAENADDAIRIMKKYGTFKIITLLGDVFNPSGVITGGSVRKKNIQLIVS